MIELEAVTKVFFPGEPRECVALRDVDLTLEKGKTWVLEGPSGSGKSTLLSLIGCLSRPTSGRITLDGKPLSGLPEAFLTRRRRRLFGVVFQDFQLLPGLTALQNILIPSLPTGEDPAHFETKARELLEALGLSDKADAPSQTLSGGQAQRVAIARALILEPEILLADEPTAHLGKDDTQTILETFAELRSQGQTLILTSHDPRVLEHPSLDGRVQLSDGAITGRTP